MCSINGSCTVIGSVVSGGERIEKKYTTCARAHIKIADKTARTIDNAQIASEDQIANRKTNKFNNEYYGDYERELKK